MAAAKNMDIKLLFEQYDMTPGAAGRKFFRNLMLHGGKTDAHGFSLADCFLRIDTHAVQAGQSIDLPPPPGTLAAPGAVPTVGLTAGQLLESQRLRRARLKESFKLIVMHISDDSTLQLVGDMTSPYFQNGPDLYDHIQSLVVIPPTTSELFDMKAAFMRAEIVVDVGVSENTIKDALKLLRVLNSEFPVNQRYSDDDIAERLLSMIANGSRHFAVTAKKELDAREGVPGTPGTREFQLAAPGAGAPRPRDLNGMVNYFHGQWQQAVKTKVIPVAAATGVGSSGSRRPHTVAAGHVATDQGMSLMADDFAQLSAEPSPHPRGLSPSRTLSELSDAGWKLQRGMVTTSDFRLASRGELARSAEAGDGGDEFCIEVACDADGAISMEMLCNCCGGAGHPARLCPSPKKLRTHALLISLHQNAMQRKEERGVELYGATQGGRRPPPRGQRAPFRGMPRRFSKSQPYRQFKSAASPARRPEGGHLVDSFEIEEEEAVESGQGAEETTVPTAPEAARQVHAEVVRVEPPRMPTMFSSEGYYADRAEEITIGAPVGVVEVARLGSETAERTFAHSGLAAAMAAAAALLACILAATWDRLREYGAKLASSVPDAAVALPAGVASIAIILIFCARGGAGADLAYYPELALPPHEFETVERCLLAGHATSPPALRQAAESFNVCWDSGCTAYAFPASDRWMLDQIDAVNPNLGLEVASGTVLKVETIGRINSTGEPRLVCDSFTLENGVEIPTVSAPTMTRVLATKGLKETTRLAGVKPARVLDGTYSYFNDDNSAGLADCLRFADGSYTRFANARHEVMFRVPTPADLAELHSRRERGLARVGYASGPRSDLELHASLGHCSDKRVRLAGLTSAGASLDGFTFDAAACRGCRLGKAQEPPRLTATAPSRGPPPERYRGSVALPSTTGYEYYGQRVDTDLSTSLPRSWPHGFTCMMNFCDRFSADFRILFTAHRTTEELVSCLEEYTRSVKRLLKDGVVSRWHTDNEKGFDGLEARAAVADLIERHTLTVPNSANKNPIAERNFGTLEPGIRACLAYADAPDCLWPWAAAHLERVLHFMPTRAHQPPTSPFRFLHPEAGVVDMSWARPLFCDVTVHLTYRDVTSKVGPSAAEGCYLGHDFVRRCEFVYVPSLRRLGSFTVDTWRVDSFVICRGLSSDTPVEYHQLDDLRYGPSTAALLPKQMRPGRLSLAGKAAEKEGAEMDASKERSLANVAQTLAENARYIADGVKALEKEGAAAVDDAVVRSVLEDHDRRDERLLHGEAGAEHERHVVVTIEGNDIARKVAQQYNIPKIRTIAEAQASQFWPLIREAMEEEIAGKMANKAWKLERRTPGMRVLKSRWVIDFKLNDDGSIKRIKARFVGCGYSQVEGLDYDKTYAATLPGCCLRLFCSIVADEDLDTDNIDAVKAFTQSSVDREIFVEMPEGFAVPGYVLRLYKALEGIKQGSYLWFQHNKWAWNKCGLFADLVEPNLYRHAELGILAAVFADDVGSAFPAEKLQDYLRIRAEYGKLIKIDAVSPETVTPLTKFTGINIARDRSAQTVTISMGTYIRKLMDRRTDIIKRDMPTPRSKELRQKFEMMKPGTAETAIDRTKYLEALGEIAWPASMVWVELSYYTSSLGQFSQYPTQEHLDAVHYVMGYLFSDPDRGITYGGALKVPYGLSEMPPNFVESRGLYAATDSSWATKARPHGGHVVFRCNGAILWSSRQLKIVADSSAHAETAEGSRATKAVMFLRMALEGIGRPVTGPTHILGDNAAMHDLVVKEGSSSRSRHFERATIFIKYAVIRLIVVCLLVGTKFMSADVLTKATDEATFKTMRSILRNQVEDGMALRALSWVNSVMRMRKRAAC